MQNPKSAPKAYRTVKEANETIRSIREMIGFDRVKILEVVEGGYRVEYNGNEIEIADHEESHWASGSFGGGLSLRQELRQTMSLVPESGLYQDRDAPEEFIEVMMFHEIREKEYAEAGFEDAHARALRDEALYITQHFDGKTQQTYLEWAKEYRLRAAEKVAREAELAEESTDLSEDCEGVERDEAQAPDTPWNNTPCLPKLIDRFSNPPKHYKRPKGIDFEEVRKALEANPDLVGTLSWMEKTDGAPDIIAVEDDAFIFADCSKESPIGRRGLNFDQSSRMPDEFGVELMDKAHYHLLQKLGRFDTNSKTWLKTPPDYLKAGYAIIGDREAYREGVDKLISHDCRDEGVGWRGILRVPKI